MMRVATSMRNADARRHPDPAPRITYISWAADCSRSDHTARELGGRSHMVYATRLGSRASTIVIKYLLQWVRTARILRAERPDVVFVMTPPVFAALPAFWYAYRRRKQVVVDAHTCAFVRRRWTPFLWLQHMLCRRAVTTLVTNEHIAHLVRDRGGHATLVPDVPVVFPSEGHFARGLAFTVAVICSFTDDEPLPAVLAAARHLPDVQFYVTGDASQSTSARQSVSSNVTFTGFLRTPDYGSLVTRADVVMDLTRDDHTMLRGAYEAIYQAVPVIVSDWSILREAFPIGAVHVDNSPDAIIRAVRSIQRTPHTFREGAQQLRHLKLNRWQLIRRQIVERITAQSTQVETMARNGMVSVSGRNPGEIRIPAAPHVTTHAGSIRKELDHSGFARAFGVFEPRELDEIESILDPMMFDSRLARMIGLRRDLANDTGHRLPRQPELSRPTLISLGLKHSTVYSKCRLMASEILGCRAQCLFNHAIYKMAWSDTETPWHQDLAYVGLFARNIRSLHFWIPLQDTPVERGALRFVAGSHKWSLLSHGAAYEHNRHVLQSMRSPDRANIVDVPLQRGDVSIHTSLTLHASGPNATDTIRKAWIIHFGDASATYKYLLKLVMWCPSGLVDRSRTVTMATRSSYLASAATCDALYLEFQESTFSGVRGSVP